MQSTLQNCGHLHVAVIMDGNGRWAARHNLPRSTGHRAGLVAARRIVEVAPDLGIATLTLFAFSADNWRRPAEEVTALIWLLRAYIRAEVPRLIESNTRLTVIGRRDRLPARLRREICRAERRTASGRRLHLRVAFDYSARQSIFGAAAAIGAQAPSFELFGRLVSQSAIGDPRASEVDLLIRSGGEKRLSDFLLWECAYAELWFTDLMWPEFGAEDLRTAIADFRSRERRFGGPGGLAQPSATASVGCSR